MYKVNKRDQQWNKFNALIWLFIRMKQRFMIYVWTSGKNNNVSLLLLYFP